MPKTTNLPEPVLDVEQLTLELQQQETEFESQINRSTSDNPVVNWILQEKPSKIGELAEQLFPGHVGKYSRLLFYTWVATVYNRHNPNRNPKVIPVNFIGAAGYGKSAITYDFGRKMSTFLTEKFKTPTTFHILVKTLAGVLDLTDVVGISHIQNGRTKIATPHDFPMEDGTVGILFLD